MDALIQIGLMALAIGIVRKSSHGPSWQLGIASALLSTLLWCILDGLWQAPWLFGTVEPVLLVALQVAILSAQIHFKATLAPATIALFAVIGIAIAAGTFIPGAPHTYGIQAAFDSGLPIAIAAIATLSTHSILQAWNRLPQWVAIALALSLGLTIDSVLYIALSSPIPLWQNTAWLQPLSVKLADKLTLALGIATPAIAWRMSSTVDISPVARDANQDS